MLQNTYRFENCGQAVRVHIGISFDRGGKRVAFEHVPLSGDPDLAVVGWRVRKRNPKLYAALWGGDVPDPFRPPDVVYLPARHERPVLSPEKS